jgi:hypothetical protein
MPHPAGGRMRPPEAMLTQVSVRCGSISDRSAALRRSAAVILCEQVDRGVERDVDAPRWWNIPTPPKLIVPSVIDETRNPERPSYRYSIVPPPGRTVRTAAEREISPPGPPGGTEGPSGGRSAHPRGGAGRARGLRAWFTAAPGGSPR